MRFLLIALLISMFGCKKGDKAESKSTSTADREVEVSEPSEDEEDDFVVAEASAYISGANLQAETVTIREIGSRGRSTSLFFNPATSSFSGKFPADGYFIIRLGGKVAVVAPSAAPLKLVFRRYNQMTERLLDIAVELGAEDLLTSRTLDIGAFSYLGLSIYRESRRNPDFFEAQRNEISALVKGLIERNRELLATGDAHAISEAQQNALVTELATVTSAKSEAALFRKLSDTFGGGDQSQVSSLEASLNLATETAKANPAIGSMVRETLFVDTIAKLGDTKSLPRNLVEQISVSVWKQIKDLPIDGLAAAVQGKSPGDSVSKFVEEASGVKDQPEEVTRALFDIRKWRPAEKVDFPGLSVAGGTLQDTEFGTFFAFLGISQADSTISGVLKGEIYLRKYLNGYWYETSKLSETLSLSIGHLPAISCLEKVCFVSIIAGEEANPPPPEGGLSTYKTLAGHLFMFDDLGNTKYLGKRPADRLQMRKVSKDQVELSVLTAGNVTISHLDALGTELEVKSLTDRKYTGIYAYREVLALQAEEPDQNSESAESVNIWTHYFILDNYNLVTKIDTSLAYGALMAVDPSDGLIAFTLVSQAKENAGDYYMSQILVYEASPAGFPTIKFSANPRTAKALALTGDIVPGHVGACRLTDNRYFMFASDFYQNQFSLHGYDVQLPITQSSVDGKLLDSESVSGAILDCTYQQGLFWLTREGDGQKAKVINISDDGAYSSVEILADRGGEDNKLLGLGAFSTKTGMRAALFLDGGGVKAKDLTTTEVDYSKISMSMFLFE